MAKYTKEEQLNVDVLELIRENLDNRLECSSIFGIGNNINKAMHVYDKNTKEKICFVIVAENKGVPNIDISIAGGGGLNPVELDHYKDTVGISVAVKEINKISVELLKR